MIDFGAIEVQAVYISGNVRKAFKEYMKDPVTTHTMSWPSKNYPTPDYLSSSRKRLVPQLIFDQGRHKCRAAIEALTDEQARQCCRFSWGEVSFLELLLYNMRHVQEHAAQLNLILGQKIGSAPGWVARARSSTP